MLYELELVYNSAATTNIRKAKGEGAANPSPVTWFYENIENQSRLSRLKKLDSEAVLPAKESNLTSSTRRVSGELVISRSSVIHNPQIGKTSVTDKLSLTLPKYCKTFYSLVY